MSVMEGRALAGTCDAHISKEHLAYCESLLSACSSIFSESLDEKKRAFDAQCLRDAISKQIKENKRSVLWDLALAVFLISHLFGAMTIVIDAALIFAPLQSFI